VPSQGQPIFALLAEELWAQRQAERRDCESECADEVNEEGVVDEVDEACACVVHGVGEGNGVRAFSQASEWTSEQQEFVKKA
jgi:hypothetical protein